MTDTHENDRRGASESRARDDGISHDAGRIADTTTERFRGFANRQKDAGLDRISEFANAARKTADTMREQNSRVAELVDEAANGLDRFSSNFRERDVADVYASLHDFARRQPLVFAAGSFAAGILLARFLKSSPPAGDTDRQPYHPSPNL